jgi:hypothetical protein
MPQAAGEPVLKFYGITCHYPGCTHDGHIATPCDSRSQSAAHSSQGAEPDRCRNRIVAVAPADPRVARGQILVVWDSTDHKAASTRAVSCIIRDMFSNLLLLLSSPAVACDGKLSITRKMRTKRKVKAADKRGAARAAADQRVTYDVQLLTNVPVAQETRGHEDVRSLDISSTADISTAHKLLTENGSAHQG